MSYLKSNIDIFAREVKDYTADEVQKMTTKQFEELPLSDQISIYHNHRAEYDRLTGRAKTAEPTAEDTRSDAQRFADEFEKRVDDAIRRAFHPNEG